MMLLLTINTVAILLLIGVVNRNLHTVSYQIQSLQMDIDKIKGDIEKVNKATKDNAFETMLDKPTPLKYWDTEALYKSHGGQVR